MSIDMTCTSLERQTMGLKGSHRTTTRAGMGSAKIYTHQSKSNCTEIFVWWGSTPDPIEKADIAPWNHTAETYVSNVAPWASLELACGIS